MVEYSDGRMLTPGTRNLVLEKEADGEVSALSMRGRISSIYQLNLYNSIHLFLEVLPL